MASPAAAAITLRCGGGKTFLRGEDRNRTLGGDRATGWRCWAPHQRPSCSSLAMRRWAVRSAVASPAQLSAGEIAAFTSVCVEPFAGRLLIGADHPEGGKHYEERDDGVVAGRDPVTQEKLDEWMRDSVSEIVRNIGEAPFLVHVFSNGNEGHAGLRLEREAANSESWPYIRRKWSACAAVPPDGVILVEELKEDEEDTGEDGAAGPADDEDATPSSGYQSAAPSSSCSSSSSKTWGVLVQGRGADRAACYILNTCRVRSSFGFCTHFCLARAKCFGDTAEVQLRNAWLLGRKYHHQQRQ